MWKGVISFGMVVIPVSMFTATASKPIAFHYLHKKCLTKPKQVHFCEHDKEYFGLEDTVRGYEYAKDQYVVLKDSDFEKVPVKSLHNIEVSAFVKPESIDPLFFNTGYYLQPEAIAAKPFALFRQAMVKSGLVGVAKITYAKREHLCCLRPKQGTIALHTLHHQHEIVPVDNLEPGAPPAEVSKAELDLALSLLNAMSHDFRPQDYTDEYHVALEKLVAAKLEGRVMEPVGTPEVKPVDLMAALRASVETAMEQASEKLPAAKPRMRQPARPPA
jgi:DNA end-binding protein Ku